MCFSSSACIPVGKNYQENTHTGMHTCVHKRKPDEKKALASQEKLKGILGKISAEEEALRKGTPTVNFL